MNNTKLSIIATALALSWLTSARLLAQGTEPPNQAPPGAEPDAFAKNVNQGLADYQAGRYEQAIESFRTAKAMKNDPKLAYNVGRCYEKLGRVDEAIGAYQEFVNAPGTTSQERAKGLEQIKALQAEKAARDEAARPQPKHSAESAPTEASSPQAAPPSPPRASASATGEVRPEKSHVLEWTLITVGAAGIVAGSIFGGLTLGQKSTYDSAITLADKQSARDAGNRDAVISDITMGVGAVAAIAGLAILIFARGDEPERAASIGPAVDGKGFAATFSGRF
jgi:tetratricopeptide (TPR) repeat protein